MGRQIEVALSEESERAMLAFLREREDVRVLRAFAEAPDQLFVDAFEPRVEGNWHYYLWNSTFPWVPAYAVTNTNPPSWYVCNANTAPLIEYTRHTEHGTGRLYWCKHFSAADAVGYDVARFERWYNSLTRWVRRHASRAAA